SALCAIGAACACIPTGWLADRVGVRRLLVAGQVGSGLALAALLLWPTYGMLLLAMLLVGGAHGATMVLTTKALVDWFPRERRATVMGAKFVAQSGAGSVAGLVLPALALACGWRLAFAVVGGLLLATAVGVLLGYRDHCQERPPTAPQLAAAQWRLWHNRPFWRLVTVGLLFGGAFFGFTAYLTLYLHERLGYAPVLAGSLLALAHGAAMASRVPYGWVSDRWLRGERLRRMARIVWAQAPWYAIEWGERRTMLRGIAILASGALLALLLRARGPPASFPSVVDLLHGAAGLGGWGGPYQTLAAERAGRDTQGLGTGLATTCVQLGSTVMPLVFGTLVDATGSYTV